MFYSQIGQIGQFDQIGQFVRSMGQIDGSGRRVVGLVGSSGWSGRVFCRGGGGESWGQEIDHFDKFLARIGRLRPVYAYVPVLGLTWFYPILPYLIISRAGGQPHTARSFSV